MTSPTLYHARYLLPVTSPPIEDGALLVADGVVLASGTVQDLSRSHPDTEVVDFADGIILPPFVNAHTHLELTDFSQWSEAAGEEDKPPPMLILILPAARSASDILPDPIGTDIFSDENGDKRLVFFWTPENEKAKRIKVEWTLEAVNPVDLESERIKINNRYLSIKTSDKESSSSLVETQSIGDQISRIRLLNVFYNSFTIDELREICFIMAVDYQDIPGSAKRPKIFGLIEYFSRRGEIADLIEAVSRERPKTAWRDYFLKAGYTI